MKLKSQDTIPDGGWKYHPGGSTILTANSLSELHSAVVRWYVFAGKTPPPNIQELIEHQICARQSNLSTEDSMSDRDLGTNRPHRQPKLFDEGIVDGAKVFAWLKKLDEDARTGFVDYTKAEYRAKICQTCTGCRPYSVPFEVTWEEQLYLTSLTPETPVDWFMQGMGCEFQGAELSQAIWVEQSVLERFSDTPVPSLCWKRAKRR